MIRSVPLVVASLALGTAAFAQAAGPSGSQGSSIGYPSVAAALQAVKANPKVKLSTQKGWITGVDDSTETFWSFPPPGHAAYPAVVQRHLVDKKDGIFIEMRVACEAPKPACDKLVADFKAINAGLRKQFEPKP